MLVYVYFILVNMVVNFFKLCLFINLYKTLMKIIFGMPCNISIQTSKLIFLTSTTLIHCFLQIYFLGLYMVSPITSRMFLLILVWFYEPLFNLQWLAFSKRNLLPIFCLVRCNYHWNKLDHFLLYKSLWKHLHFTRIIQSIWK